MKCIKNTAGEVRRVKEDIAASMVSSSRGWAYCPKSEWKAIRSKTVVEPVVVTAAPVSESDEAKKQIKADKKKIAQAKRKSRTEN